MEALGGGAFSKGIGAFGLDVLEIFWISGGERESGFLCRGFDEIVGHFSFGFSSPLVAGGAG